ncbi:MAG: response regulator [Bacteroidetes bacterium]|nr:response regulator [Bacteroidota bacterium]
MVFSIVKEYDMIHMENQPEKGFVPDSDTPPEPVEISRGNETILFVDDEIYLADVGREMLEDYGYCVDIMTSSRQAFELFEKNQDRYDLLITDYTMPEMTGIQLVEKIHAIRPKLPVIMCTGIELSSDIFKNVCISKILMKPFDMEKFVKGVREVLDTPGC